MNILYRVKSKLGKGKLFYILGFLLVVAGATGGAYAAFSDKNEVKGVTISVGSADIKLLQDLAGDLSSTNLVDTMQGPSFANISQTWTADFPLKVYNNATSSIDLFSTAFYETANDPADLRSSIYVEPIDWVDSDGNGNPDPTELGTNYGKKTIVKWKTEGFDFGSMTTGEVRGLVLRFSTQDLSTTKQGATATFDFELTGIALD
ncbi:hypothetical protein HYV31_03830 [candidate division WWE3 bacterium]|nr:hypothetical protein [candidate division WWE3 bacterium]